MALVVAAETDFALVMPSGLRATLSANVESQTSSTAWLEAAAGLRTPIQGSCFLGRSSTNHIVLPDDRVSRRHTMVHVQGGHEFWVIDLGSSNGTYLNGRRITQPTRLTDRDRLELGGQVFTFHHPQAQPASDPGPATTEKTIQDIKSVACWLLVADMESSTQFIQAMKQEEALRLTARWLSRCKQLIEERSGTVNKFLGDGFLAYWPDRAPTAGAVAQALQSLAKLQDEAQPRFRIALHYGKVFLGGSVSLGEESLLGNEVNYVFRMEKLAASMGAARLLSAAADERLHSLLTTRSEGEHPLPSFEGQFLFYSF